MQTQQITTVTTFVPVVGEGELQRQLRKVAERDGGLGSLTRGRMGDAGNGHDPRPGVGSEQSG